MPQILRRHESGLSECQERALEVLNGSIENVFLTGSAGTGKSYLIREFLKGLSRKTFPIVASTGVAAVLVGGRTFHSFFGLGIMEGGFERTVEKAAKDKNVLSRLRNINGFVLDEVSMISGMALRAAEKICRLARKKNMPWGGARVVAVGDFAQLPPVSAPGGVREWAFLDECWEQSYFTPLVLRTVLRTEDEDYIRVLNHVRHGVVNDEVRAYLDRHVDAEAHDDRATHLLPTRLMADRQNMRRLAEIDQNLRTFETEYSGRDWAIEQLKKNAPIPEVLKVKKSAFVMIRVNDPAYKYVNGSVGTVEEIEHDKLIIRLMTGPYVEIEKQPFCILDAEGKEIARATNFPVTLAYAMTIHKAQGVTLDRMVADLRGLWEPGQAYVALSRLRSGDGLTLVGWDEKSIRIDPLVAEFHDGLM